MKNVDIEKIMALKKTGWKTDRIASDMHLESDTVDKVIAEYETRKKETAVAKQEASEEKEKEVTFIPITPEQLKNIYERAATIGAKEALKTFEQERKKEYSGRADRRLRNTKLLLRNFRMLKEHAERSVFGRTQMEESAMDILESMMSIYNDEVIIQSIKNSATRTAIIVSHIETMFGLYYSYCDRSTNREIDLRRYNVVWDMYMAANPLSAKEIADKQNVSKESVYSDLRVGIERLTALIFGVEGLDVR